MRLPQPKKPAHRKRLREWENWLELFRQKIDKKHKYSYIPNAAWLLNSLYWQIAEQYIRPLLSPAHKNEEEHRIHQYKIISASEITVMMTEPIKMNDPELERKYNAFLAWFVATQILENWDTGSLIKITSEHINKVSGFKEHITKKKLYPETFRHEHINWLINLNPSSDKTFFVNAQCWRLFYMCCLFISVNGKLK